jgi:hypothetical protein
MHTANPGRGSLAHVLHFIVARSGHGICFSSIANKVSETPPGYRHPFGVMSAVSMKLIVSSVTEGAVPSASFTDQPTAFPCQWDTLSHCPQVFIIHEPPFSGL